MKKLLVLAAALPFALATLPAQSAKPAADAKQAAAKPAKGKSKKGLLKALVAKGIVPAAAADKVRSSKKEAFACRDAVKAKKAPKGSCLSKFLALNEARRDLFKAAVDKVKSPKAKERLGAKVAKFEAKIKRIQGKLVDKGKPKGKVTQHNSVVDPAPSAK